MASGFYFRPPDAALVADVVARALAEDRAQYDVTSNALIPPDQQGRGVFLMKEQGVVCGLDMAREAFEQLSPDLDMELFAGDGSFLEP